MNNYELKIGDKVKLSNKGYEGYEFEVIYELSQKRIKVIKGTIPVGKTYHCWPWHKYELINKNQNHSNTTIFK